MLRLLKDRPTPAPRMTPSGAFGPGAAPAPSSPARPALAGAAVRRLALFLRGFATGEGDRLDRKH